MLLLTRLHRRVAASDREAGVALVAVIGLLAVGIVISALILASVTTALGTTTSSRAAVQSQAAAEAGIAAARVGIETDTCTTGHYTGENPDYDAQVSFTTGGAWFDGCPTSLATGLRITSTGSAAHGGVNGATGGDQRTVVAEFDAPVDDPGSGTLEPTGKAVYAYTGATVTGSGSTISGDIYVKSGSLICDGGTRIGGDVVVAEGDFTMSGSCYVDGGVYASGLVTLGSGSAEVKGDVVGSQVNINNSLSINGSVWARGASGVNISNAAKIGGNVTSAGPIAISNTATIGGGLWGTTLTITSGAKIGGGAYMTGAVSIDNSGAVIGGDAVAVGPFALPSGRVKGTVYVPAGDFTNSTKGSTVDGSLVARNVTLSGGAVGGFTEKAGAGAGTGKIYATGTVHNNRGDWAYQNMPGYAGSVSGQLPKIVTGWAGNPAAPAIPAVPATPAPPAPVVPQWIDWTYQASDWDGFTILTVGSTGACTGKDIYPLIQSLGTSDGVIDARSCTSVDMGSGYNYGLNNSGWQNPDWVLKSDVAIISKKYIQRNGSWTGSGGTYRLWLLQEDKTADNQPTCNGQQMSLDGGGLTLNSTVQVMIYTPCPVTLTRSFTGQVYSDTVTLAANVAVTFAPIGLPNYDLDDGTVPDENGGADDEAGGWTLNVIRNIPSD